jgi:hypothetical protein
MFRIVQVIATDFPTSDDHEEAQTIADELNRDAIDLGETARWIVVHNAVWESLQTVAVA